MTDLATIPPNELTLDQLRERVGRGLTWLADWDPDGHYHFHYNAGFKPGMLAPKNWDADKIAGYRDYYHARRLWHELDALLEKRERELSDGSQG